MISEGEGGPLGAGDNSGVSFSLVSDDHIMESTTA